MKKMPDKHLFTKRAIDNAHKIATAILKSENGELKDSPHDYQCFIFKNERVCIVFYPHKTSTGNYYMRVRNQNSKDSREARRIMQRLYKESGDGLLFHCKELPQ